MTLIGAALGFIVGVILALTGAGGGILAVPLLVFGLGLSVAQAGPIGLFAVGIGAALGAILGLRAGTVRYKAALLMALAGMLASPFGLWLVPRLDNPILSILFSVLLLFVAYRTFRQAKDSFHSQKNTLAMQRLPCLRHPLHGRFIWNRSCVRVLALSGALAGLLSGLLGVGGGFVMVPALRRYTDLTASSTIATSMAVIALVSLSGVAVSAAHGQVSWAIAMPFSSGTIAGMVGAGLISSRLAAPQLQRGFAALAALVAIGMFAKAWT